MFKILMSENFRNKIIPWKFLFLGRLQNSGTRGFNLEEFRIIFKLNMSGCKVK